MGAKVIAFANQKGGVAKTTSAAAFGAVLVEKGYKVLWIDLDPQHNLSSYLGAKSGKEALTVFDVLTGEEPLANATLSDGTSWVVPSSERLSQAEKYIGELGRECRLRDAVRPVCAKYDYIIIDTPPKLDVLTLNALTAAGEVIIPMTAEAFSREGFRQFAATVRGVKRYANKRLQVAGVLLTRYIAHTNVQRRLRKQVAEEAKDLKIKVFEQTIRHTVIVQEAQDAGEHIMQYRPKSKVADDYRQAVDEYLNVKKGESDESI